MSSSSDSDSDFINGHRTLKKRKFNERKNFLETLDDNEFHRRFRVTKQTFQLLCDKIRDKADPATAR